MLRSLCRSSISLLALALIGACPAAKPTEDTVKKAPAGPGADDPRVEQHGKDLYVAGNAPDLDSHAKKVSDGKAAPGSGRPDETNGVCRLFSPKLPTPQCCPYETGFDVDDARKACGFSIYLGESMYSSCGYYFAGEDGQPVSIRVAPIRGETVKNAAAAHDSHLARVNKDDKFASTPIPGIDGALWSRSEKEGYNWAFIPGWNAPRRVAWTDKDCSREGMRELIEVMVNAKEPSSEDLRNEKIPTRRRRSAATP